MNTLIPGKKVKSKEDLSKATSIKSAHGKKI